jgi:hypothetical protein
MSSACASARYHTHPRAPPPPCRRAREEHLCWLASGRTAWKGLASQAFGAGRSRRRAWKRGDPCPPPRTPGQPPAASSQRDLRMTYIESPKGVPAETDQLVQDLQLTRGYPTGDFETNAANVSVGHSTVVVKKPVGARDVGSRSAGRSGHRGVAQGRRLLSRAVQRPAHARSSGDRRSPGGSGARKPLTAIASCAPVGDRTAERGSPAAPPVREGRGDRGPLAYVTRAP